MCWMPFEGVKRKKAIYASWKPVRHPSQEMDGEVIAIEIVLPAGLQEECASYLASKGINKSFVYSD